MASKISINLDTSKENFLVTKCKQNDDLTLEAYIYENGAELSLTNKEIIIQALKADNTYIIQNTEIIKENNKILAELDRDFSKAPGTTKIEIVLVESGKQNTTFSFYLEVSASVIKGAVESSNTVTVLEALDNKIIETGQVLAEAIQVKEDTEQLIESGGAATTGDIANINASLEHKSNLTNEQSSIKNKVESITQPLNIYNFAQQGNFPLSGLYSALAIHNYNDAPGFALDYVGTNVAQVINMANNPVNRADKDSKFCGSGDYIALVQTYFSGESKLTKDIFRIRNNGELAFYNEVPHYIRVKRTDLNDGSFANYFLMEKEQRNIFAINNGGVEYYKHLCNTADHTIQHTPKIGANIIYNFKSGMTKFTFDKTDDGLYGLTFAFTNKLTSAMAVVNGADIIFRIDGYTAYSRAATMKLLTTSEIAQLPNNTLFLDGNDGIPKIKLSTGVIKAFVLS